MWSSRLLVIAVYFAGSSWTSYVSILVASYRMSTDGVGGLILGGSFVNVGFGYRWVVCVGTFTLCTR